jgi:ADP-L-glycero-D-manno-heptose 6-epimerase
MYLITGGAGFIGSNLAAALSDRGVAVAICDWLGRDERWRNLAKHELVDLVLPEALQPWLAEEGARLQAVIHLGANSSTAEADVDLIMRQNVRASLDLLRWCTQHQKGFLYASSGATYGDGSAGFDDDGSPEALARLRPLNAYGWSKHFVDRRIARLAADKAPLPPQWVGLKFFNVYGPNEYHKGSMKSIVAQNHARVAQGESVRLFRSDRPEYTDGGQLRDFIYVRDCVEVMLWLLEHRHVSGLFNVGTGQARSWMDLATALFQGCGRERSVEFIDMPSGLREKYQYFTEARMERLRRAGYSRPFTSLEDGVRDYVQKYLSTSDPYR